ncbi:LON peptidase substrate-binding domain-containing protein [Vibrio mimicus]|uniref:LON peptidase substrate-binding domain-containing protein n=1 Tax=Vibrio mimicus TaxID=674 RepID=UPI0011D74E1E|nr:LON peptidase substrate-binding domain-containing protein [Vibrio mimicus]TXY45278.1 ATP-dependent protease [Vibrio mimicus]
MEEIMLFPLSSVVLPEGKMKLRIFEPRYQRMVAQCSKTGRGFGLCLYESKLNKNASELSEFGTLVKIVDFETLSDGLLGITVVGMRRFEILKVRVEYDGLRIATVQWLPDWPNHELLDRERFLGEKLQEVYQQFPQIGELHSLCFFDDASWVCQRWLELLPLTNAQFDVLVGQRDHHAALSFLLRTIESRLDT